MVFNIMNMRTQPTYSELMTFTDGKWETMATQEEQQQAYLECVRERERRNLEFSWKHLCPPEYRNTIFEQLPNLAKFEQAQKWRYGPMGLLLVGLTRRGKTRSAWNLLERLHFDERREILAFAPMDLKLAVAAAWQDAETAEDWIFRLRNVDVLFFDDLDTVKFTEAVEETIYDAFEFRPMHRRPVIATVNRSGRELAARMNTNGRGAKIVERMREYCQVINFT
jgi:DNA replication protein DnaC